MKHPLPELDLPEFSRRLARSSPILASDGAVGRLYAHYCELRRWNQRVSLIGPGTVDSVIERHYAESLAGLESLDEPPSNLVDIGSGGGFPGFVLGAVLPETQLFLVEARERKCAFLRAASRRAGMKTHCLHVRLDVPLPSGLPEEIDLLTLRAIRLSEGVWKGLVGRLSPTGRVLLWAGAQTDSIPVGLQIVRRSPLADTESRQVITLRRRAA